MSQADPDTILSRAMDLFMTGQRGSYSPGAPVIDQWAQAVAAALEPDTDALRRGQADAVRGWLGQAASDEEQRRRRIALTTLCMHLPALDPADAAQVRDDPAQLIKLADTYLHIGDEDDPAARR